MSYPRIAPTGRAYDPGDWPVKTYRSQNGAEVRLLYGSVRTGMTLRLDYANVPDATAQQFLEHYNEMNGTFRAFSFDLTTWNRILAGWGGSSSPLKPPAGTDWRYDGPPSLSAVRPGVSTVSVTLRGVI